MSGSPLPIPLPGDGRCVRCLHIFLLGHMRAELAGLWCPWCVAKRPGSPHGKDAASCECRLLARLKRSDGATR